MNGLTRHQAAVILGTTDQTITNYCKAGLLGSWKGKGNILYVNADDVEKYKDKLKMTAASERLIELKQAKLKEMRAKLDEEEAELRAVLTCEHRQDFGRNLSELVKNLFRSFIIPYTRARDVAILCDFIDGLSIKEIADKFEISPERCRQILVRAMRLFGDANKIHASWRYYCDVTNENHALRKEIEILKKKYEPESIDDEDRKYIASLLSVNLADLNISVRVLRALDSSGWGVATVGDLVKHTRLSLLGLRNFGKKCLSEVDDIVDDLGLDFMHPGESEGAYYKRMIRKPKERRMENENKV